MFDTCCAFCDEMKERMQNLTSTDHCILGLTSALGVLLAGMMLSESRRNWKPLIVMLFLASIGYILFRLVTGDEGCCCCDEENWDESEEKEDTEDKE